MSEAATSVLAEDQAVVDLAGASLRADPDGFTLIGGRCQDCGTTIFPSAEVCPRCMAETMVEVDLPRQGEIYAWSTLHIGPPQWFKPYTLAYVDLANGVRVLGRIEGEPAIGASVGLGAAVVGETAAGQPIRSFVFRREA